MGSRGTIDRSAGAETELKEPLVANSSAEQIGVKEEPAVTPTRKQKFVAFCHGAFLGCVVGMI